MENELGYVARKKYQRVFNLLFVFWYFIFMYVYVSCLDVWILSEWRCPQRPEEGIWCPEAVVTCGWELLAMGGRNPTPAWTPSREFTLTSPLQVLGISFFKQGLSMWPWLAWNSLFKTGWTWIQKDQSIFWVLGLKTWATSLCQMIGHFSPCDAPS